MGEVDDAPWRTYTNVQTIDVRATIKFPMNANYMFRTNNEYVHPTPTGGLVALERVIGADYFDFSETTQMDYLFQGATNLKEIDTRKWDLKHMTRINSLFNNCWSLVSVDVSNWDVTNVVNMGHMMFRTYALTDFDMSNWQAKNVLYIDNMFHDATAIEALDFTGFDTSKVINSANLFTNTDALRVLKLGENSLFTDQVDLPEVDLDDTYSGKWVYNQDLAGDYFPLPCETVTSWDLMHTYDGTKAGEYVWAPMVTVDIHFIAAETSENLIPSETVRGPALSHQDYYPPEIFGWSRGSLAAPYYTMIMGRREDATGHPVGEQQTFAITYYLPWHSIHDPVMSEETIWPIEIPDTPVDQRSLNIDYASNLQSGIGKIANDRKVYHAHALAVASDKEAPTPNFVQVTDYSPSAPGWQLSVRQKNQFVTKDNDELVGAALSFDNIEMISVHDKEAPSHFESSVHLTPAYKQTLIKAQSGEGLGTWIYRFGNEESAEESIHLEVPDHAIVLTKEYTTALIWTIEMVP